MGNTETDKDNVGDLPSLSEMEIRGVIPVVTCDVVEETCVMLANRQRKSAIKATLEQLLDRKISVHTMETIYRKARDRMMERFNTPQKDSAATAIEFYESVIANPNTTMGHKIKCQERLDLLFGLLNINNNNDDGIAAEEKAAAARRMLADADESVGANDTPK